jgi:hypothetical protein
MTTLRTTTELIQSSTKTPIPAMTDETIEPGLTNRLMSDDQYIIIMASCSVMLTVVSILGSASNIINIRTFIAMGLTDGVTVSFLLLSIFDLSFLVVSFCYGISIGLNIIEKKSNLRFQIEPYGLFVFFGNVMILLNVTNTLTTTFVAVARCMCVAKPLQFKITFSRSRTIFLNIGFATFAMAIYIPILAHMGMLPKTDKKTNITRPSLWISKDRQVIKDGVWLVINTILPFLTEVIIMVCVFVMARSLRTASKFRQASTLTSTQIAPQIGNPEKKNNFTTTSSDKMRGKDQRVVQQVILISIVYIICNTPKILISIVSAIEPQFTVLDLFDNLYLCVHSLQKYFEIFNASVNTIIYYNYNTKFRTKLRLLVNIYEE